MSFTVSIPTSKAWKTVRVRAEERERGHQFLNLTFMRADERERGRLIEDLTFKGGNWEEVENEGELTDSQQRDEKRKSGVCVCACVWESDNHRGDNRLLRLAGHTVMQVI